MFNKKLKNLAPLPEKKRKKVVEEQPHQPVKLPAAAQVVLTEKLADQAAKQAGSKITTYFMPKSFTWWVGVAGTALGIAKAAGLNHPAFGAVADVIGALTDGGTGINSGAAPATLIVAGLGLIGIRAKMSRLI